ncbi:MAG: cardiolipin synthase, partial [Deltaproteobacteria bacterium]
MLDTILWLLISIFSLVSAGHALLNKRDPRAALIWILLCFTLPGLGAGLYWLLGINRIRTRARDWQARGAERPWPEPSSSCWLPPADDDPVFLHENNVALLALADAVTRRPLVSGNRVDPLFNGEQAYPAMLEAIEQAKQEVNLSTYIFGAGKTGRAFIAALEAAAERGVAVRVLIDGVGERYDFPPAR